MAGKHVGNDVYVDALTHRPAYPGSHLNLAWREGREGNPATNPHPTGTPLYNAYEAGKNATSNHEVAGIADLASFDIILAANEDDGYDYFSSWISAAQNGPNFGLDGGSTAKTGGSSWPANLAGKKLYPGVPVTSAILHLDVPSVAGSGGAGVVAAEKATAPAVFSASHLPSSTSGSRTTASAAISAISAAGKYTVDITSVVNEIINLAGWTGERINTIIEQSGMSAGDEVRVYGSAFSPTGDTKLSIVR